MKGWLTSLGIFFASSSALAQGLYLDAGLGATSIMGGTTFFGQGAAALTLGAAGNTFIAYEFNPSSAIQIHLGAAGRLNVGMDTNIVNSTLSVFPAVRIEGQRVYTTLGLSPGLIWKRAAGGAGITGYQMVTGALGAYADVGLLWRPVNYWHMALAISAETYMNGGVTAPYIFGAFIEMRFYIFQSRGGGSGGGPTQRSYDGWRYPFGVSKK